MTLIEKAELITAINGTIIANRQAGTYKVLEYLCINTLEILIRSIKQEESTK